MKRITTAIISSLMLTGLSQALAQIPSGSTNPVVPAIDPSSPIDPSIVQDPPPPPVHLLSHRHDPALNKRERASVSLAQEWQKNQVMPARGNDGRVIFTFGTTLPSVICAPLYVCAVDLQPGESVNNINIGDQARWKITPASSGSGATEATTIIIKPTDVGLMTDLIISTDRRTYILKLVSRKNDWMSQVSFLYPEEQQAAWANFQAHKAKVLQDNTLPTGQHIAKMDFNFQISDDHPSWTPLRVYSDGLKTYIQFPANLAATDAPALVALNQDGKLFSSPTKEIVNYRLTGDTYVVDKVLQHAALITGVGANQIKVDISYSKDQH